jgi:hypothetical protein
LGVSLIEGVPLGFDENGGKAGVFLINGLGEEPPLTTESAGVD